MANTIKCTDSMKMPFSATFIVPATFESFNPNQFSIAVSTDHLIIYKEIIDYPVTAPVIGPCGEVVVGDVTAKLGQVKVSGAIMYRAAANGIQSDSIVIADDLQVNVNVGGNMWSSADGFVDVTDGTNNYMIVGFTLPDKPLQPGALTVTLSSLVLGSIYTEERSYDKVVTLEGEFTLSYDPV